MSGPDPPLPPPNSPGIPAAWSLLAGELSSEEEGGERDSAVEEQGKRWAMGRIPSSSEDDDDYGSSVESSNCNSQESFFPSSFPPSVDITSMALHVAAHDEGGGQNPDQGQHPARRRSIRSSYGVPVKGEHAGLHPNRMEDDDILAHSKELSHRLWEVLAPHCGAPMPEGFAKDGTDERGEEEEEEEEEAEAEHIPAREGGATSSVNRGSEKSQSEVSRGHPSSPSSRLMLRRNSASGEALLRRPSISNQSAQSSMDGSGKFLRQSSSSAQVQSSSSPRKLLLRPPSPGDEGAACATTVAARRGVNITFGIDTGAWEGNGAMQRSMAETGCQKGFDEHPVVGGHGGDVAAWARQDGWGQDEKMGVDDDDDGGTTAYPISSDGGMQWKTSQSSYPPPSPDHEPGFKVVERDVDLIPKPSPFREHATQPQRESISGEGHKQQQQRQQQQQQQQSQQQQQQKQQGGIAIPAAAAATAVHLQPRPPSYPPPLHALLAIHHASNSATGGVGRMSVGISNEIRASIGVSGSAEVSQGKVATDVGDGVKGGIAEGAESSTGGGRMKEGEDSGDSVDENKEEGGDDDDDAGREAGLDLLQQVCDDDIDGTTKLAPPPTVSMPVRPRRMSHTERFLDFAVPISGMGAESCAVLGASPVFRTGSSVGVGVERLPSSSEMRGRVEEKDTTKGRSEGEGGRGNGVDEDDGVHDEDGARTIFVRGRRVSLMTPSSLLSGEASVVGVQQQQNEGGGYEGGCSLNRRLVSSVQNGDDSRDGKGASPVKSTREAVDVAEAKRTPRRRRSLPVSLDTSFSNALSEIEKRKGVKRGRAGSAPNAIEGVGIAGKTVGETVHRGTPPAGKSAARRRSVAVMVDRRRGDKRRGGNQGGGSWDARENEKQMGMERHGGYTVRDNLSDEGGSFTLRKGRSGKDGELVHSFGEGNSQGVSTCTWNWGKSPIDAALSPFGGAGATAGSPRFLGSPLYVEGKAGGAGGAGGGGGGGQDVARAQPGRGMAKQQLQHHGSILHHFGGANAGVPRVRRLSEKPLPSLNRTSIIGARDDAGPVLHEATDQERDDLKDGNRGKFEVVPLNQVEGTDVGVRLFGAGQMLPGSGNNDITGLEKDEKETEKGQQHSPIDPRLQTGTHNQRTAVEDNHHHHHHQHLLGGTPTLNQPMPPPPPTAHHKTPPPGAAAGHTATAGRALAGGRRRSSFAKPQAKHMLQPPPSLSEVQGFGTTKSKLNPAGSGGGGGGVGDGACSFIDPVTAPRPIDEKDRPREYQTSNVSVRPIPKASSKYRAIDTGNCSARFIRLTANLVPSTWDLQRRMGIPIGALLQPLAVPPPHEAGVPFVDEPAGSASGMARCNTCRAYLNSMTVFTSEGRVWICNLCGERNKTYRGYFSRLEGNGKRKDWKRRPELCCGTFEFPSNDSAIAKTAPAVVFVLDASKQSINSGLLESSIDAVRSCLDHFDAATNEVAHNLRVGLIVFDASVHFLDLRRLPEDDLPPRDYIMTDTADPFVPHPFSVVPFFECKDALYHALDCLPQMFHAADCPSWDSSAGAAIKSASLALAVTGGKVIAVLSSPTTVGFGSLSRSDCTSVIGGELEWKTISPDGDEYPSLAQDCADSHISVDLFVCSWAFTDLASVGMLTRVTGGQLSFMPLFTQEEHSARLIMEMTRIVSRKTGFRTVFHLQCSSGWEVFDMFGCMPPSGPGEAVCIPSIDEDKAFAAELKLTSDIPDHASSPVVQATLAYTGWDGLRRVRVMTLALATSTSIKSIFKMADCEAVAGFLLKKSAAMIPLYCIDQAMSMVEAELVAVLCAYIRYCKKDSVNRSQLMLPESMKLLPLYCLCLQKLTAFSTDSILNVVPTDERTFQLQHLLSLTASDISTRLYPRMYQVHNLSPKHANIDPLGYTMLPKCTRLSIEAVSVDGAYLLSDANSLVLWVHRDVSREFLNEAFGVMSIDQLASKKPTTLSRLDTPLSRQLHAMVTACHERRALMPHVTVATAVSHLGKIFHNRLVEDVGSCTVSYTDFLCKIHVSIQRALSLT